MPCIDLFKEVFFLLRRWQILCWCIRKPLQVHHIPVVWHNMVLHSLNNLHSCSISPFELLSLTTHTKLTQSTVNTNTVHSTHCFLIFTVSHVCHKTGFIVIWCLFTAETESSKDLKQEQRKLEVNKDMWGWWWWVRGTGSRFFFYS